MHLLFKTKLALAGGTPVRANSFAPWPHFSVDEIAAAVNVLKSGKVNYWTGHEGRMFESEFAATIGGAQAVAVANGTVALELALRALDIGAGDEVIVPSRTFIASASCVVTTGAKPVFADVDRVTQNITVETIRRETTTNTKAVIVVHLAGWPSEMPTIVEFAGARGIKVIEDCAQAQGARYNDRPVGSFGDIAAFSFCQDKIVSTAGEGGMVVTSDPELWQRVWSFKDHGKNYQLCSNWQPSAGFHWVHESVGTNLRMTEVQSAIGRVLLRKLDQHLGIRLRNATILTEAFSQLPALRVTQAPEEVQHAFYKYYVFLRLEHLREGWNRDRLIEAIRAEGIPCFSGSCSEVYLEKAFPEELRPSRRFDVARELGETSLMFLVHPTLSESDMIDTYRAVEKVLEFATSFPYSDTASC